MVISVSKVCLLSLVVVASTSSVCNLGGSEVLTCVAPGLTEDHPTLTTYFEGEMIGDKYSFQTRRPEWGSSEKNDHQHWSRFPAFRPLAQKAKSYEMILQSEFEHNVSEPIIDEARKLEDSIRGFSA